MNRHILTTPGADIVIQSCDSEVANVGVFVGGRGAYHHITLPACERRCRPIYSNELPAADYDRVLSMYRDELLARMEELL